MSAVIDGSVRVENPRSGPNRSRPGSAHVSVDVTTELRWFFDGALPPALQSWFTRSGTVGLPERRCDVYRLDGTTDAGVKRRSGATVELKCRLGPPEPFVLESGLAGLLERWQRWSPADGLIGDDAGAAWGDVHKAIVKRRFDVFGEEVALTEATRAMSGCGCDAEIVDISASGRDAWSFALAAFGPLDDHRPLLHTAWRALSWAGGPPPELMQLGAEPSGYPEWLAGLDRWWPVPPTGRGARSTHPLQHS